MINDAVIEGNPFEYKIEENTKRVYKAYCGNCGSYNRAEMRERSVLKYKSNAKNGDKMCRDCGHALYWEFERVKINHGNPSFTQNPHDLKGLTMS